MSIRQPRKPIAVALSTVAMAGITALAVGGATPASAQSVSTSQRSVAADTSQQAAAAACRWGDCHRWHHRHHHHHGYGNHWRGGWGRW